MNMGKIPATVMDAMGVGLEEVVLVTLDADAEAWLEDMVLLEDVVLLGHGISGRQGTTGRQGAAGRCWRSGIMMLRGVEFFDV